MDIDSGSITLSKSCIISISFRKYLCLVSSSRFIQNASGNVDNETILCVEFVTTAPQREPLTGGVI